MARFFLALGAVFGGGAVAAGAFAAHALRGSLSPRSLDVFETAARYQMYHALALLAIALSLYQAQQAQQTRTIPLLKASGIALALGTLIFSGSLYSLSVMGIAILGAITPLGGLGLLVGWGLLAIAALRWQDSTAQADSDWIDLKKQTSKNPPAR